MWLILPDRKTIPGTAGGTVRDRAVTVAFPIYKQIDSEKYLARLIFFHRRNLEDIIRCIFDRTKRHDLK